MAAPLSEAITALRNKLPQLEDGAFVLVTVPVRDVAAVNVEAVKILEERGCSGVYVCISKDYLSVTNALTEAGASLAKMRFVDAVSRMYGIAPEESGSVTYAESPMSSNDIIDGIASALIALKADKRYVLLDSLTALQLYNSIEATVHFAQTLQELLKREHVTGLIVVSYRKTVNEELVSHITKNGGEIISTAS